MQRRSLQSGGYMKNDYDVIVTGAGPAGLTVAMIAAAEGCRVLLVEQKKDIAKVYRSCCCNLIIEPNTHRETVCFSNNELVFERNKFTVPYSGRHIVLTSNLRISPGGRTLCIRGIGPEGAVAVSFEKEVFLEGLLMRARKHGVEILSETRGLKAENIDGRVRVTLANREGEFTRTAQVAVAADGVNSQIVQNLGFNQTRRKHIGMFGVASYHMEGVDCPYPDAWTTFVGKGHASGGRGQLYLCRKPYRGTITPAVYELTCGVPISPGGTLPGDEIDFFTKQGRFASWFSRMRILEKRGAILNFYTPLLNPVEGNIVVVGDAAAFIETYVQGAVMYGYQAGKSIARHLATGTGLDDYAASWRESFEYNDPETIKRATQVFGLHVMSDDDLDYLFGLTEADDIPGYLNEFSDPGTIMNTLMKHFDQIAAERPALAGTLANLGAVSVEDALQVNT